MFCCFSSTCWKDPYVPSSMELLWCPCYWFFNTCCNLFGSYHIDGFEINIPQKAFICVSVEYRILYSWINLIMNYTLQVTVILIFDCDLLVFMAVDLSISVNICYFESIVLICILDYVYSWWLSLLSWSVSLETFALNSVYLLVILPDQLSLVNIFSGISFSVFSLSAFVITLY